ncbi:DUF6489 family protein [Amaricoccus sp.]|uniref:DUF6489 family protein n=1 Tax=Amaricoccus sp. TaxID=1872485 RepID=UPI001B6769A0|nr:DUF6489 family protein [Amaricoccus sp.]MBP7002718.1 hypothetical protein [Amaricoccus sp.]
MKITVNVDCTPEEARAFLGLPDVKPMQEELMGEIKDRMTSSLRAMQPDEMLRTWLPANLKGFEQMYESFLRMSAPRRE